MISIGVMFDGKLEPEYEIIKGSNGKQGIESKGGLIIYHPTFDSVEEFDMGQRLDYDSSIFAPYIYKLGKGGRYGLIEVFHSNVTEILPIEYDDLIQVTDRNRLFVVVKKNEKCGLYERQNGWLLPLDNDDMSIVEYNDYSSEYSYWQTKSRYLLIQKGDKYGIWFIPYVRKTNIEYELILPPIDEYGIRVKKDGVWGYLDKNRRFTPNLNEVPMEWENLGDIHIDRKSSILHEINRGKKQVKSEIDIPVIDMDF